MRTLTLQVPYDALSTYNQFRELWDYTVQSCLTSMLVLLIILCAISTDLLPFSQRCIITTC